MLARNAQDPMARFQIRHKFGLLNVVISSHETMADAEAALADKPVRNWGSLSIVDNSKDVVASAVSEDAIKKLQDQIAYEDLRQSLLAKRRQNQAAEVALASSSVKTAEVAPTVEQSGVSLPSVPADMIKDVK